MNSPVGQSIDNNLSTNKYFLIIKSIQNYFFVICMYINDNKISIFLYLSQERIVVVQQ